MSNSGEAVALAAPAPGRHMHNIELSKKRTRISDVVAKPVLAACAIFSGAVVTLVLLFIMQKALPLFVHQGVAFVTHTNWDVAIMDAWDLPAVVFGALPLIVGSAVTTVGALIVAVVLGLGCAVFLAEFAPEWLRRPVEAVIQLLAGIPSVVFGLVGMSVVVPLLTRLIPADAADKVTDVPLDGACLLAAVIVLSFMILPFFVTVAVDSMRAVPRTYMEGGLALGMDRWRTIRKIQIPAAGPGLFAGAVLASARGIGEAIALSMVSGSMSFLPTLKYGLKYFPFMPIRTMAAAIVETGGEAMSIPTIQAALFGLAALLLISSLMLSVSGRFLVGWLNRRLAMDDGRAL